MKRCIAPAICAFVVCGHVGSAVAADRPVERPNIVLCMTDGISLSPLFDDLHESQFHFTLGETNALLSHFRVGLCSIIASSYFHRLE